MPASIKAVRIHKDVLVGVPAADFPWVTEWDWHLEDGLAARYKGGKRVLLYHELVQFNYLRPHRPLPLLGSRMTHMMFGHKLVFRKLRKIVKKLEARAKEADVKFPNYIEILTTALGYSFCEFLGWRQRNVRYVFLEPAESASEYGICVPGNGPLLDWATMDGFMYGELTGRVDELGPEEYADRVGFLIGSTFRHEIEVANPGHSAEDMWDVLTTEEGLMEQFIVFAHATIGEFPLPDLS